MKKIKVNLQENSYPIFIGSGVFSNLLELIKEKKLNRNIFIITDKNVDKHYKLNIESVFKNYEYKLNKFVIKAGEESKCAEVLNRIYANLLLKNYGRDTLIIALGGGVVGDLAGYAAATFMRGVQFVQVPTTLLAAVDSSVGGKTGINFEKTKNIIGAFYQPKFVIIDANFIKTLNRSEIICGIGEIVKYAFLADENFYNYARKNIHKIFEGDEKVIEKLIYESVKIKAGVVEIDEKESGLRKILNLGHTFAHAYESILEYKIKHGEAVIAGLSAAIILANKIGIMNDKNYNEYIEFVHSIKITKSILNLDKEKLYAAMLKDKKNREGRIKFVLPKKIGNIIVDIEIEKSDVIYALSHNEILFEQDKLKNKNSIKKNSISLKNPCKDEIKI